MKKVIVTPAGRRVYLEILLNYLNCYKNEFDRWDIWLNTAIKEDIEYINTLEREYDFINVKRIHNASHYDIRSIFHCFKDCTKDDEVYLRLDDDIVYIHPGSLTKMFNFRVLNSEPFLIYGNIINNSIITHIHQRIKNININDKKAGYNCTDGTGWSDPYFAEQIHNIFLENIDNVEKFFMPNWELMEFERVSINAISFTGKEFKNFNGEVDPEEEYWLSSVKPKLINRPNLILGDAIFVHFAFNPQRQYLETTNLLNRYLTLSKNIRN